MEVCSATQPKHAMFFRVFSVPCNGLWEEFQFLRHMPTRLRVYQHGANVEPHFGTCLSIFFGFLPALGSPFFGLMICRTVASLSSSQGGEGKSDPRQDGARRNVRGDWTRCAAMGRQRCVQLRLRDIVRRCVAEPLGTSCG